MGGILPYSSNSCPFLGSSSNSEKLFSKSIRLKWPGPDRYGRTNLGGTKTFNKTNLGRTKTNFGGTRTGGGTDLGYLHSNKWCCRQHIWQEGRESIEGQT